MGRLSPSRFAHICLVLLASSCAVASSETPEDVGDGEAETMTDALVGPSALVNGSFEQWTNGGPSSWSQTSVTSQRSSTRVGGALAVEVHGTSTSSRLWQTVRFSAAIPAGTRFEAKASARYVSGSATPPDIRVNFYGPNGALLRTWSLPFTGFAPDAGWAVAQGTTSLSQSVSKVTYSIRNNTAASRVFLVDEVAFGAATASAPCVTPGRRDPAYHPFAQRSPWNMPIGSSAQFAPISSPGFRTDGGFWVNAGSWSHPVYVATASDPIRSVYSGGRLCATLRVPSGALPAGEADGHLHLIGDSHQTVVETYQARRRSNGDFDAAGCVVNSLTDDGVYSTWHGTRAYGGSAIGGLIRVGELAVGIPHALALSVRRAAMNKNAPGGNPYVWPASSADSGWQTTYGTTGNLHMGSLVAIRPNVDLAALGFRIGTASYNVARAMLDYGAYVTDATSDNMNVYVEPRAASEVPADLGESLARLLPYLHVVTNNAPTSVGGGGTPRRCLAATF